MKLNPEQVISIKGHSAKEIELPGGKILVVQNCEPRMVYVRLELKK